MLINFHHAPLDLLGVVPIVVNAGTALLPAIVAGFVSVVTILFRPRQWGTVVRQKPWVPVLVVAILCAGVGGYFWMAGPDDAVADPRATRGRVSAQAGGGDWTAVALAYIDDKKRRAAASPTGSVPPIAQTSDVATGRPFVFRADMQRSGVIGASSPTGLKESWRWVDPDDALAMYCSSFATDGKFLYGASATLVPPDTAGAVFCLDSVTGKLRWVAAEATDVKGKTIGFKGFFSSPALTADGKYLLIGEGLHTDSNSALLCFETQSGKLHWRIPTTQHLESSPAIAGDIVVIGAGAIELGDDHKVPAGGDPGFVLAVRISDGKELWRAQVNDPESTPAIADGIVYIGSGVNGNEVVALRIDTAEELKAKGEERVVWRTKTPFPALAAVTVTEQLVLVGCGDGNFIRAGQNGMVIALDRKTGQIQWQTTPDVTSASVLSAVAVRGDIAVVGVGNGEVVALDLPARGKLLWRTRVSETAAVNAGAAVTDRHVYALSADGWLTVLGAKDGSVLERHFVNDRARPGVLGMTLGAPIVAGGRVFVGSETGAVRAYAGSER